METHRRLTCLLEDPSETEMPDRRPICLIRDSSETSTCFIKDPSETNMPHWRLTCIVYKYAKSIYKKVRLNKYLISECIMQACVFDESPQACQSPMGHVGVWWGSDLACRSPMSLRSGMSVSDNNIFVNSCVGTWHPNIKGSIWKF